MNILIEKIFNRNELINQPPVLVDVGASGAIHKSWKPFSKYCICVAFDADDREFQLSEKEDSNYKKLYKFNCIVSDKEDEKLDFYLTKNPYCSSTLQPDASSVKNYVYDDGFEVVKKTTINNISLSSALKKLNLERVDWLKTDSQGTDLRIYSSLTKDIRDHVIVVEFEPGLAPGYQTEDSAYHVLSYMSQQNFWLSGFDVKGVPRGSKQLINSLFKSDYTRKLARHSIKKAPKWVEMLYINTFNDESFSVREYLLGCTFSLINGEFLNALNLSRKGYEKFHDDIFKLIEAQCVHEIRKSFVGEKVIKGIGKKMLNLIRK